MATTDEQRMRNEFEEIRVAECDIGSVDIDPETGEYTRRSTYEAWGHFQAGWAARDEEVQALREALSDMLSGWHYIRANHGDLYGVGWERAQAKAEAALAGEKGSSDD